jgi:beta-glucanase (GH16 family)
MKNNYKFLFLIILFLFVGLNVHAQNWQLVWSDEFETGISGDWVFETGGGGWGNNELEYYRQQNASVQNGKLLLTAKQESFGGMNYTSVRMKTQGKKSWKYGKIEASIAVPSFTGAWPAFWMLGDNIGNVGWPACGEIDIMEHVNTGNTDYGTIHWQDAGGAHAQFSNNTQVNNIMAFHTYTVIWDANAITWLVDGVQYAQANIANNINNTAAFHNNFFILLNFAIGGNWPGYAVDNGALPNSMQVEYVRVYQDNPVVSTTGLVTVFKDCNYGGFSGGLGVGDYTTSQLNAIGVQNNDVSSLRVTEGYKAILYDGDNFTGNSMVVTADNSCIGAFNDVPSSIQIRPNGDPNKAGIYFLQNRNSGLYMDVSGGLSAQGDGANIQQWTSNNQANQQFQFTHLGDGVYQVLATHSMKSMDIDAISTADGANVQQWTYFGSANQQFIVFPTGDGFYKLIPKHSGKVVEVAGYSTTAGGNVQQWTNVNQTSGMWKFVSPVPVNGTGDGLAGNYFNGMNFDTPVYARKDATVNFDWGLGSPNTAVNVDSYSARWTGQIQPRYSGTYTFYLNSDNGRRLWINNQLIIDKWIDDWGTEYTGTIMLTAGQKYDIKLEYFEDYGGASCKMEWSSLLQGREVVPQSQLYSNAFPVVSITTPANNASFTPPANVNVTATASDSDGSIAKVDYYNGTTLLGSTASPYTYAWNNLPVGTYTIKAVATDNKGAFTISSPITFTVNNNPVISFANITKTYGDPNFTVSATSNSPGAITYSITAGSQFATISSNGQVTIKGAGTVTIQASQGAATGYNAGTATATLTINKATLTATGDNQTKVYNTANPILTISYSGFAYGETASVLTASPTTSTTATLTSNVGSYPITLSGGFAANYNLTLVNGTLTITKATPTITYTGATSGTQGASITLSATSNSTGTISYSVANGTGSATLSGTTLNLTSVGTVTVTVTVGASTNYASTSITQVITIIAPANQDPTITFANITKTYGDPSFSVSATSTSPGTITYSITAGSQFAFITPNGQVTIKGAGTVTIQASQSTATGYNAGTATATLIINKAALIATADNQTKVYNTANPTLTISYSGFAYGETTSVLTSAPSSTTTATQTSNVGTYPITLTGGAAANYSITLVNSTLTVTQATPTIIYTGAANGTQGTSIALSGTSNSTGPLSYSVTNGTGSATVVGTTLNLNGAGSVTLTISVASTTNYTAASITQLISITAPANLDPTITFANVTATYGDPSFKVTATSNSSGAISYSITTGSLFATITPNGQVTIKGAGTVTIQATQAAAIGYNAGTASAMLTINKSSLTITANNQTKIYNSANPDLTISYSGFVNGESSSVLTSAPTVSTTATQTSDVGTYPIILAGASAANYTISQVNGTLTITQATPTLTYTGATTGTEGASIALFATSNSTGVISYAVSNGTGSASLSGTTLNLTSAGTVTITITVAASTNYATESITQVITIDPVVKQNPTIVFNDVSKFYGDTPFYVTATSSSSGTFIYSILTGAEFATITSDGLVTIIAAGTVTLMATEVETSGYNSGIATATLTINKSNNSGLVYTGPTSGTNGSTIDLGGTSSTGNTISYQLAPGGTGTAVINGSTLTLTGKGSVYVYVTVAGDANHNPQTITQEITITDATGVNSPMSSSVLIEAFPNPAIEFVNIRINGLTKAVNQVGLYDLEGKLMIDLSETELVNSGQITIPMSNLSSGMYILRIETEEGFAIKKINK